MFKQLNLKKELLENLTFQLFPKKYSMKPSIISNDITASIIPIINTAQNANLIINPLIFSK